MVGLLVVFALVFTAFYAMIKIPYSEAIRLWRGEKMSGIKTQSSPRRPGSTSFRARNMPNRLP